MAFPSTDQVLLGAADNASEIWSFPRGYTASVEWLPNSEHSTTFKKPEYKTIVMTGNIPVEHSTICPDLLERWSIVLFSSAVVEQHND